MAKKPNRQRASSKKEKEIEDMALKESAKKAQEMQKAITSLSKSTITLASSSITSSAFGASAGNIAGSMIGKALEGASAGIPGIISGATIGLIEGLIKNFNAIDDVFKKSVKDTYDGLKQEQKDTLGRGISYVLKKEQAFSKLDRWKDNTSEEDIEYLEGFSGKIAVSFESLANAAVALGPVMDGTKDNFKNLVDSIGYVGAALQLDSQEMGNVALAFAGLQKEISTESFSALEKQGIEGYKLLLNGLKWKYESNINEEQLKDMVAAGKVEIAGKTIDATEIAKIIGDSYQTQAEEKSNSYSGLMQRHESLTNTIAGAAGQGYMEMRTVGLKNQVEYMEGAGGERQSLANEKMGKWEAALENKQEELHRGILDSVMSGEGTENEIVSNLKTKEAKERIDVLAKKYQELEGQLAGAESEEARLAIEAEQGNLLKEAKGIAENEYKASDEFQKQQSLDLELVNRLREDTAMHDAYFAYGVEMQKAFSKGRLSTEHYVVYGYRNEDYYQNGERTPPHMPVNKSSYPFAFGMAYVPYDNFPALLHQGERVLTAGQARTADGQARRREGVVVNIGDVYGNTKNDAYDIARILVSEITRACEVMV